MNEDLINQYGFSNPEIQNMMQQAFAQAFPQALQAMPKVQTPSWAESALDFIKMHPWASVAILFVTMLFVSAVIRELICSYLKTSEIIARLKKIEDKIS